ncbi:MAG: hypothetical protein ACK4GU_16195 [Alishewanella aestuarii]
MSEIVCPHCHGSVPHGAKVCRGCQAEIQYGCPPTLFLVLIVITAFLGFKISAVLPDFLSFMGWVVGIGGFVLGSILLNRVFEKRVNFKRIYKTK